MSDGANHQRVSSLEVEVQKLKKSVREKSSSPTGTGAGGLTPIKATQVASGASAVSWTSIGAKSSIAQKAQGVYGSCRLKAGLLAADETYTIDVRKDSSDSARNALTFYDTTPGGRGISGFFICPVTEGGVFQYQVTTTSVDPASFDITIEGYF